MKTCAKWPKSSNLPVVVLAWGLQIVMRWSTKPVVTCGVRGHTPPRKNFIFGVRKHDLMFSEIRLFMVIFYAGESISFTILLFKNTTIAFTREFMPKGIFEGF